MVVKQVIIYYTGYNKFQIQGRYLPTAYSEKAGV